MARHLCLSKATQYLRHLFSRKLHSSAAFNFPRGNNIWPKERPPVFSKANSIETSNHIKQSEQYQPSAIDGQLHLAIKGQDEENILIDLSKISDKELLLEESKDAKSLYALIVSSSIDEVLTLVNEKHKSLNKVHYALAMKTIFKIFNAQEDKEKDWIKENLKLDNEFQILCAMLALKGQYYQAEISSDMLVFMHHLGLKSDHPTMQVYLQLIKYHINDLSLVSLARISYSLTLMAPTKQTEFLLKAIGILCNLRQRDIPGLTLWQKATLFEIHSHAFDSETLIYLIDHLLENEDRFTPRLSSIMLRGLANIGLQNKQENKELIELSSELMNSCIDCITHQLDKLKDREIISVLISCNSIYVYDLDLFSKAGTQLKENGCDFYDAFACLKAFQTARHYDEGLMEIFQTSLLSHEHNLSKDFKHSDIVDMMNILSGSASTDDLLVEDSNVKSWTKILCKEIERNWDGLDEDEKMQCCLGLMLWGKKIDKLKSVEISPKDTSKSRFDSFPSPAHRKILLAKMLDQVTSVTYNDWHTSASREVGQALTMALGMIASVFSPEQLTAGLPIDHIVHQVGQHYMDQDSNKGSIYKENRMIAVLVLNENCFYKNTGQLLGTSLLLPKLIQDSGYKVVLVNYDEWKRMPEEDMLPYLRRKIDFASDEQDLVMMP